MSSWGTGARGKSHQGNGIERTQSLLAVGDEDEGEARCDQVASLDVRDNRGAVNQARDLYLGDMGES